MNPFDQFAGELNAALPPSSLSSSQQPPPQQPSNDALIPAQFQMMPPQQPSQQQPQQQPPPMMNSNGMTNYYGNTHMTMPQGGGGGGGMMMMMGGPTSSNAMTPMNQSSNNSNTAMTMSASSPFASPPPPTSGALVPSHMPSNPYALPGGSMAMGGGPPNSQPPPPLMAGPPPPQPQIGYGAAPTGPAMNPFGAPSTATTMTAAPPPGNYAPPPRPALAMDPFAPTPAAPSDPWSSMPPAMLAADPWGGEPTSSSSALVPSTAVNDDPFGIFGGASPSPAVPPPQQQQQPQQQQPQQQFYHPSPPQQQQAPPNDDPWADLGFGSAPAPPPASTSSEPFFLQDEGDLFDGGIGAAAARAQREASAAPTTTTTHAKPSSTPSKTHAESRTKSDLPPGGEWYDAKIFTPTLGVMFFKPKELIDSLFLQTDKSTVEALRDRPVVAFIVEGSSARSAGVELGHVLLKVNGIDVKNPKEASRLIKEGPRPLPLLFYVPDTKVVVAEGEHMVKYNTKETSAPNSAKDWKPKYVVIGGIIAQPWMMNMYRSKSEYDIAVIETQARRPISVKVKQFSLQGARIQNDWQGPQMVKYKNKLHPWKYIVVLPVSRNPIKIASPNLSQLKPVHEGIRRVLNAQQSRSGGGGGAGGHVSVQPIPRDPYRSSERRREDEYNGRGNGGGGYNGRDSGF